MLLLITGILINVMMADYEFDMEKAKAEIKKTKAKTVLIQLPDGLKPNATKIAGELAKTGAKVYLWAGSCFGACDIPHAKVDLLIQFGHSKFK
jgi:2-(3-amino-3-carboxypropyl)histidine synthase